jgi:Flp pilus assembly protein CpaB
METTKIKNASGGSGLQKLLSTRRGTAIVAGICTALAAGILLFAAVSYRHSVAKSSQPQTVLVAKTLIQKGTSGSVIASSNMFQLERIPAQQVTPGAVADASALRGKVAATDINRGQQLTLGQFKTGGGYAVQLAPDQRAISVPLDASHGLTGALQAGDRVDVYAGVTASASRSASSASAEGALRLLIPDVPVLAVNLNTGGGGLGAGANSQADVLLKVNNADVGGLALASDIGNVWLVLRGPNAKNPTSQHRYVVTANSLMLGGGR